MILKALMFLAFSSLVSMTDHGKQTNGDDDIPVKNKINESVMGKELSSSPDVDDTKDLIADKDKEIALKHLDGDIEEFEGLKRRIETLEDHLRKHANRHIVDDEEIRDSDKLLKEMDRKVIKPFEDALIAIRKQIKMSKSKFDNKSIENIISLVQKAESYVSIGQEELENMEMIDQEWQGREEGQQIQDEIYKGIMKEKFKSEIFSNGNLKTKLRQGDDTNVKMTYPLKKSGGRMVKLNKSPSDPGNNKKYIRKGLSDINGKFNSSRHMERMKTKAIKELKRKLDEEALKDNIIYNEDSIIGHQSAEIKKAFDEAAESSHKFIDQKLHHLPSDQTVNNIDARPYSISRYFAIGLGVLALLVLFPSLFIFFKTSDFGRSSSHDMTKKTSSPCQQVYLQLDEVKEAATWGYPFSAPRHSKIIENKLK